MNGNVERNIGLRPHFSFIKQSTWLAIGLFGCLAAIQPVQAASFDCGKAQSRIEKMICADAGLSKQDEEMSGLYGQIMKASSDDPALKKAQRDWLKYRQVCLAPGYRKKEGACLSHLYSRHIDILRGSLPTEPDADTSTSRLCAHIAALVERNEAGNLEPTEYVNSEPRGKAYGLDIDGDGIADSVEIGCGSSECDAEINLASGKPYDIDGLNDGRRFYLIRYESRIYALASYSEDDEAEDEAVRHKYHLGRLFLIGPTKAKMVCGK